MAACASSPPVLIYPLRTPRVRRKTKLPMKLQTNRRPRAVLITACLALTVTLAAKQPPSRRFEQTNLVSDVPGLAAATDPHLVNAWGMVASASSPWWVADNGTGLSTLYTGAGGVL